MYMQYSQGLYVFKEFYANNSFASGSANMGWGGGGGRIGALTKSELRDTLTDAGSKRDGEQRAF